MIHTYKKVGCGLDQPFLKKIFFKEGHHMSDIDFDRLEKQLDGNSLALNAIAEVLAKMDTKLDREESVSLAKEERLEKRIEKESLIREVSSEVLNMIKAEFERPAKPTGKNEKNADDSEKDVTLPAAGTDEVQKPIVMKAYDEDEDEDEEDEDMEKDMKYRKAHTPEHDEDEDEEDGMEKSLKKQISALQKQLNDYDSKLEKAVKSESESRLRQMGFREETSLQSPQRINTLGVEDNSFMKKAVDTSDIVEQLSQLSYKELKDMQTSIEAGQTEGIPRELLQG